MDLKQIAAGDYTSITGSWIEEAHASNGHGATGYQWKDGGTEELAITRDKIVAASGWITLQGKTLTVGPKDHAKSSQMTSARQGGGLEVTLANEDVAINRALGFYPKGTVGDSTRLDPHKGVTFDDSLDTIYLWSSAGTFDVFVPAR